MNYQFNSSNLLNWITAFALFEIPMAKFYLSITNKVATSLSGTIVTLPCSTSLTKHDQQAVIEETLNWVETK